MHEPIEQPEAAARWADRLMDLVMALRAVSLGVDPNAEDYVRDHLDDLWPTRRDIPEGLRDLVFEPDELDEEV